MTINEVIKFKQLNIDLKNLSTRQLRNLKYKKPTIKMLNCFISKNLTNFVMKKQKKKWPQL